MSKIARLPTTKTQGRDPPASLSVESATWWRRIVLEHDLTDAPSLLTLSTALHSYDRANEAAVVLKREGLTVKSVGGSKKTHPAVAVERNARVAFLRAMASLRLDALPIHPTPGRPPTVASAPPKKGTRYADQR